MVFKLCQIWLRFLQGTFTLGEGLPKSFLLRENLPLVMGTFSPGCVFFKVRFLQIPWHLSTWNVFYLFVVIYWIQVPFVSWAAPEKWSAFGLGSCIRSRIYHWRSDPFPDFQFSQSNLLSFVCVSYSLATAQTLAVLWI